MMQWTGGLELVLHGGGSRWALSIDTTSQKGPRERTQTTEKITFPQTPDTGGQIRNFLPPPTFSLLPAATVSSLAAFFSAWPATFNARMANSLSLQTFQQNMDPFIFERTRKPHRLNKGIVCPVACLYCVAPNIKDNFRFRSDINQP